MADWQSLGDGAEKQADISSSAYPVLLRVPISQLNGQHPPQILGGGGIVCLWTGGNGKIQAQIEHWYWPILQNTGQRPISAFYCRIKHTEPDWYGISETDLRGEKPPTADKAAEIMNVWALVTTDLFFVNCASILKNVELIWTDLIL